MPRPKLTTDTISRQAAALDLDPAVADEVEEVDEVLDASPLEEDDLSDVEVLDAAPGAATESTSGRDYEFTQFSLHSPAQVAELDAMPHVRVIVHEQDGDTVMPINFNGISIQVQTGVVRRLPLPFVEIIRNQVEGLRGRDARARRMTELTSLNPANPADRARMPKLRKGQNPAEALGV